MPFKSQAQRALFHAAKSDPRMRKRIGLRKSVIDDMLEEDRGGKLAKVSRLTRDSLKRKR